MNFIDKALSEKLSGDDFLQAMADIYSENDVRDILHRYPTFIKDVIAVIDYDTALQMDGLDDIINGSLKDRCGEIISALERSGAHLDAEILKQARALSESDPDEYDRALDGLYSKLSLNNDYDAFWDSIRNYINDSLSYVNADR